MCERSFLLVGKKRKLKVAEHNVNIGAYITRFNGRIGTFKKGVLIKLFSSVIRDTPVDSGRLRGNWTFSKTTPPEAFIDSDANPTPVVSQAILSQVGPEDDSYFLANSMPYCNRIEYEGWSHTKAPEGMVRKNIIRIASILASQAKP